LLFRHAISGFLRQDQAQVHMTFPITSLAASQQVMTLQEIQAVSKAAMMQSFVLGESLDVLVLNNSHGNKALL
jgi:hypothetical protein